MPGHGSQLGAKPAYGGLLQQHLVECLFQGARREAGFAAMWPFGAPGFSPGGRDFPQYS
jgi:hypothetical protein